MFEVGKSYVSKSGMKFKVLTVVDGGMLIEWIYHVLPNFHGRQYHSVDTMVRSHWEELLPEPIRKYSRWQRWSNNNQQSSMSDTPLNPIAGTFILRFDYTDYPNNTLTQGFVKKLINIEVVKE